MAIITYLFCRVNNIETELKVLILVTFTRNIIYRRLSIYLQNSTYLYLSMLGRVFRGHFSLAKSDIDR